MREVPVEDDRDVKAFARELVGGAFDAVVTMTGGGTRGLAAASEPEVDRSALAGALSKITVVARGPKPIAALREIGVGSPVVVPERNTHREVLDALRARGLVRAGARVALVEHGAPTPELHEPLEAAGVVVRRVRVYRYALVDDTTALMRALERLAAGELRAALFTSRAQIELAASVAEPLGVWGPACETLRAGLVGSVGPVCSEALRAEGLAPDVEPEHPKMGQLVKLAAARATAILAAKKS
jgi:uroporphyrinogen-III synthase